MTQAVKQPFTNLQLEILKLYARQVSEHDLLKIKKLLAKYFAQKAMDLADQAWDEKGWTSEDEEKLLNEHFRKSSKTAQ
jgi:hypothetical protein